MDLRWLLAVLTLSLFAFTALPVQAATQTIKATHTYVMGDRDNKEDARALCYMTAKRKVLEEAGVLIESASEVKNFDLTKDQIDSYSAAILSVKVLKEEFVLNNGTTSLTLTVSAEVDMEDVRKRLADIAANKGLQTKMDLQQQQIRKMEQQVQAMTEKLSRASEGSKDEVRKDRDAELVTYYRLGAERGEAQAQFVLGSMYLQGIGVRQDNAQAAAWYRKAAEQGNADGQYMLGGMYADGRGVPKDSKEAVKWFRQAAEQGYPRAMAYLGAMYLQGIGVRQDDIQAVAWYRKAAEQDDAEAQGFLGAMYGEGRGVPQDNAQAVAWFRKSAEQGNADSQYLLSMNYITGTGVPMDYVQSYKWLNLAAARGSKAGAELRDKVIKVMTPAQVAEARQFSVEWEKAFEQRQRRN
jgi:TPR repeat protein